MNPADTFNWAEANQKYLNARLDEVRLLLERTLDGESPQIPDQNSTTETSGAEAGMQPPPALEILTSLFSLSPFERAILLLLAGVELDSRFVSLVARARNDPQRISPTFSLALSIFPGAHWNALTPAAPLRYWRLIELGSGSVVTQVPLRIDERILHYLTGVTYLDERLTGFIAPIQGADQELVPSQLAIVDQIASAWERRNWLDQTPVVQLIGGDMATHRAIAAAVGNRLRLAPFRMHSAALPGNLVELESLRHLWERESLLSGSLLLLDCDAQTEGEPERISLLERWVEAMHAPLILSGRDRLRCRRTMLSLEIAKPTMSEQREVWNRALGEAAAHLNGRMDSILSHFNLDAATIQEIALEALRQEPVSPDDFAERLWQACNDHSRTSLNELAQYIRPLATWDDLVLPQAQLQTLQEISVHVRQRLTVYETWGFAAHSARGLGISALFSGVSGTGKTMAAEVLAKDLKLELYRIDLSQVISKYIGETEKNLKKVFDAAEVGGSILLFDEADALFGKRSEVRDSHDRYANVEVSYLLQRMEAYQGLAILTTNLKENLDQAFMRRIRFVVHFPFPDAEQRAEIWQRIFPAQTPTEGLDVKRLARLNIPGGNIRNIAVYAAFLAADAGQPVRISHLQRAARVEFSKLERPLPETELGGKP